MERAEDNIQGTWDGDKRHSTRIMEIPEGEREEGREEMLETIITKTFPKLVSGTKPQTQEAQRTPSVPKRLYIGIFLSNYRESKIKRNPQRSQRWGGGVGMPCQQRNRTKNYIQFLLQKPCQQEEKAVKHLKC